MSGLRHNMADIRDSLIAMALDEEDELVRLHGGWRRKFLSARLLSRSCYRPPRAMTPPLQLAMEWELSYSRPHFQLSWQTSNSRYLSMLSDAEKAFTSGKLSRLSIPLSLSRSGEHYAEAIECLQSRFDQPRLIHLTHVRKIIEALSLKDGNGKELRRFHDTMQQHIRALKAMGHDPPGSFLTSLLELKLDTDKTFEWHKHSQ